MGDRNVRQKRIFHEIIALRNTSRLIFHKVGDDLSQMTLIISGPMGSPYEEGLFELSIYFGEQYPSHPPAIKFVTPIYHPNIDLSGNICLSILRMSPEGIYNPTITLEDFMLAIQLLLANPNPDDFIRADAAELFTRNKQLFFKTAKNHVKRVCLAENPRSSNQTNKDDDDESDYSQGKRLRLDLP